MVPGIWVFKGVLRGGFFMFLLGLPRSPTRNVQKIPATWPENKQKNQRNHWKINRDLSKAMYFKGKVQTKFKSSQKCEKTNCDMSKYYCGLVGGDPPRCNILTYRSLFTLFAHFVCTFKLCSNFSFEIHCFAEVSVDFSMISLAFLLICVYYTPGDRAQKVIPGGAKTNESLWKSQNNVKKSILLFPTLMFAIALVIARKKLSPEARKQSRACESLKITSKNQFYVSHHSCLLR